MKSQTINIAVTLTDEQAWQVAQYLKRIGFSDYREYATCDDEAYRMMEAGELIRRALAEQGYNPR